MQRGRTKNSERDRQILIRKIKGKREQQLKEK
jgi:hypothetical protein